MTFVLRESWWNTEVILVLTSSLNGSRQAPWVWEENGWVGLGKVKRGRG